MQRAADLRPQPVTRCFFSCSGNSAIRTRRLGANVPFNGTYVDAAPFPVRPAGFPEAHAVIATGWTRFPQRRASARLVALTTRIPTARRHAARDQPIRWCSWRFRPASTTPGGMGRPVGRHPGVPDPRPFRSPNPPSWQPFALLGSVRRQGPDRCAGGPVGLRARRSWQPVRRLRWPAPSRPGTTELHWAATLTRGAGPCRGRDADRGFLTSQARATLRYGLPSEPGGGWRGTGEPGSPAGRTFVTTRQRRASAAGRPSRPEALAPGRSQRDHPVIRSLAIGPNSSSCGGFAPPMRGRASG